MIGREAESMTSPFRARPKPFLDTARRDWQFATFAWLLRHCGGYPKFLETLPVLPIEQHFPDRGIGGHAGIAALFRRVRDHAGMADWPCMVEPRDASDDSVDDATTLDRIAQAVAPGAGLTPSLAGGTLEAAKEGPDAACALALGVVLVARVDGGVDPFGQHRGAGRSAAADQPVEIPE